MRRKRRTEWKRRQGGQAFLDHAVVHICAGKGGDGCVAFHREKFVPYGPPSGGSGGRGGDVYIMATPHLTTLSSVPTRVHAPNGGTGQGSWQNGKNAPPFVIKVPVGTIVRQLPRDDPRSSKDEIDMEAEMLDALDPDERRTKLRELRWVHYPRAEDDNVERQDFKDAERLVYREERERRLMQQRRLLQTIYLDLDKPDSSLEERDPNSPLGLRRPDSLGHLIASGGSGGVGNTHFLTLTNRSPKWATRGWEGERVTLSLELKLLADVALVGMPNAGKSTLLRALSGGRAKTEIAGYAFTTLNPVVAVIRVADDGSFEGSNGLVHEETWLEEQREQALIKQGLLADARTRNQRDDAGADPLDTLESFRFTVADNPGLIAEASADIGLGHSFLRSIERSNALAYVVDLSAPAPWDDLSVLRDEIEKYKPGLSPKARIVLANKADLLGGQAGQEDAEAVREAKEKLRKLEEFVEKEMRTPVQDGEGSVLDKRTLDVVPISAKYSMNLQKVVNLMRSYVEDARAGGIQPSSGPQASSS
ncbi:GTPase [Laetiporus sulphureus 93-53]|uniref:GTPase n=1 Tax=Laetiporus sulphureus 93-53 TaxID=1314785 RepID=A0A165DH63_9APHY|nr:GTPase [Laetiporus sulphureus 93-53]KZT04870.1 GTPase [Laetiporus sulphureus 93-53]